MRRSILASLALLFGMSFFLLGNSASGAFFNVDNVAIAGYDPVSYFGPQGPTEGSSNYTHSWGGVTWHFSSQENRDTFAANPENFAPQYGGYCAYAVANGYTASIDPEAYSIHEGKLYLNYSKSVRSRWESDKAGYIQSANKNWPKLSADLSQ